MDVSSYGGRFPWVLRSYGHQKAYVINGGIDKWKDADGRPLETKKNIPSPSAVPYKNSDIGLYRHLQDLRRGCALEAAFGVFEVNPVYRAEKHATSRHLN